MDLSLRPLTPFVRMILQEIPGMAIEIAIEIAVEIAIEIAVEIAIEI